MKKVIFLMVLLSIMLIGSNVFAEAGIPTALMYGWDATDNAWERAAMSVMNHFIIQADTNSLVGIYKDGNTADVDTDDELHVETSSDSLVGIYQGNNTAIVRDGSTDDNSTSEQGLLTQSNLYAYDSNSWNRLLIQSTNYHNLRVAIYNDDKVWDIEDWDSDDEDEGNDGGPVYAKLKGWDSVNEDWDRLRVNPMKYLYVVTSSESIVNRLLNPVTTYITESQFNELNSSIDDIYQQLNSSVTVSYQIDNSTYVYRDFYANGSLTVNFNVKSIGVYSQGGNSTITWDSGDVINVWDGIPFGDVPIDETFDSPVVFTCTLSAGTTFSIYVRGRL